MNREENIDYINNIHDSYIKELQKQDKYFKELQQENKKLEENYDRIYNENCILREKHNINDIGLLDENYKLQKVIDKAIEYIEKCLKQTPIENRTKTDDTLDIEYEYILKILKEVE